MYTITIPSKEKRNVPHTKKKKVSLSSTTTVSHRGVYGGYTTIRLLCSTVVELHAASSSPRGRAVPTPTPHTSRSSSASSGSVEPYYYSLLPHTYTQSHARTHAASAPTRTDEIPGPSFRACLNKASHRRQRRAAPTWPKLIFLFKISSGTWAPFQIQELQCVDEVIFKTSVLLD